MEMSIDKAIEEVQQQKLDYQEFWEEYKNEHIEALDMAIETMRKYQKIEQVLSDYINDDSVGMSDYWMGRIKEVMEDGKID